MLLLFAIQITQAQAHNMGANYNCKLKKRNPGTEGYPCEACTAIYKKEQNAKIAEDKRRFAAAQAEAEAKKAASEKVRLAKLAEEKKNAESGKVYINAQKSTVVTNNNTQSKKTEIKVNTNLRYMLGGGGDWKFYCNERKEETLIKGSNPNLKQPLRAYGTAPIEGTSIARYLHPAETGIIYQNPYTGKWCNGQYPVIYDIVDFDLNTLFNDDSVHYIEHFYENWFFIGYFPCNEYSRNTVGHFKKLKLYNVSSKKFIEIKIDNSFESLIPKETKGRSHNGVGDLVFHNPFYISGTYKTEIDGRLVSHGGCELLFDEMAGGNNMWKAGAIIHINKSSSTSRDNDDYMVYIIDKDSNFKSFIVSYAIYKEYWYKNNE